jgi:hypothetical protein
VGRKVTGDERALRFASMGVSNHRGGEEMRTDPRCERTRCEVFTRLSPVFSGGTVAHRLLNRSWGLVYAD